MELLLGLSNKQKPLSIESLTAIHLTNQVKPMEHIEDLQVLENIVS